MPLVLGRDVELHGDATGDALGCVGILGGDQQPAGRVAHASGLDAADQCPADRVRRSGYVVQDEHDAGAGDLGGAQQLGQGQRRVGGDRSRGRDPEVLFGHVAREPDRHLDLLCELRDGVLGPERLPGPGRPVHDHRPASAQLSFEVRARMLRAVLVHRRGHQRRQGTVRLEESPAVGIDLRRSGETEAPSCDSSSSR